MKLLLPLIFMLLCFESKSQLYISYGYSKGSNLVDDKVNNKDIFRSASHSIFCDYKTKALYVSAGVGLKQNSRVLNYVYPGSKIYDFRDQYKYHSLNLVCRVFIYDGFFYRSGFSLNRLSNTEHSFAGATVNKQMPKTLMTIDISQGIGYRLEIQNIFFAFEGLLNAPITEAGYQDNTPWLYALSISAGYKIGKHSKHKIKT